MMPQLLTIHVHNGQGRRRRLWVPLLPVLLVLSPVLVLAVVALVIACLVFRVNPFRALYAGGRLLWATSGTQVEVERGRRVALIAVR